jgi:hypothetical protein
MNNNVAYTSKPVTLEDDVWLKGFGRLITSVITLRLESVIMAVTTIARD